MILIIYHLVVHRDSGWGRVSLVWITLLCCLLYTQHNRGGGITYEGFDLNVEPAWKMGFTGKGVVVTILDDGEWQPWFYLQASGVLIQNQPFYSLVYLGIEWDHADLKDNYVRGFGDIMVDCTE